MPVFEKPLPELKVYAGTNPRPDDFDAYWDSSLEEMARLDPKVELVPNPTLKSRVAECFDLWFTGVGGARVYAKYMRPRQRSGKLPALLLFHGYSANSSDWSEKLSYVSQGLCVAALDVRGQGGLSEDVGGVKGNTLRGHIVRGLDGRGSQGPPLSVHLPRYGPAGADRDGLSRGGPGPGRRHRGLPGRGADPGLRGPRAPDPAPGAGLPLPLRLPAGLGDGHGEGGLRGAPAPLPALRSPA